MRLLFHRQDMHPAVFLSAEHADDAARPDVERIDQILFLHGIFLFLLLQCNGHGPLLSSDAPPGRISPPDGAPEIVQHQSGA